MPNFQDGKKNPMKSGKKTPTELANIQMDREFYGADDKNDTEFGLLDVDSAALRNRNQS